MIKFWVEGSEISDTESICCIIGFRDAREFEKQLYCFPDLGFIRFSISAEGFFDLQGSVFVEFQTSSHQYQEYDSTGLSHIHTSLQIRREEKFLHGCVSHFVGFYDFFQVACDFDEFLALWNLWSRMDNTKGLDGSDISDDFYDRETDGRGSRIDSQYYSHTFIVQKRQNTKDKIQNAGFLLQVQKNHTQKTVAFEITSHDLTE